MGKKILKEKTYEAFAVTGPCLQGLTGRWAKNTKETVCVWNFVDASNLSQQASALKEIGKRLAEDDDVEPVLHLLVDVYLMCPPKHQIKRAIASCLENVSHVKTNVEHVLTKSVLDMLSTEGSVTSDSRRNMVDNLNSLLENFHVGETSLQNLLFQVLSFLSDSLGIFHELTRLATTPVAVTEAMHHCHVTVQVWNKLVSRSESNMEKITENIHQATKKFLPQIWDILMTETFLTDCRAACGMTLPLYLKVISQENDIQSAVSDLFPVYDLQAVTFSQVSKGSTLRHSALTEDTLAAWPTARICVVGGCLAMLDVDLLMSEVRPGESLIVDVIGRELLGLLDKVYDTNSKVLLSRTLVIWTGKAINVLEQNPSFSQNWLSDSLHGRAHVPSRLLDYAWNHWEDAIDVIRHQARLIFDNLLQCHLWATREQPSKSEFLLGLFNSLISTGWQNQGRYGPLCCLVGYLGAGVILERTPFLPQQLLESVSDQTLAGYVSELYEKMFTEHWHEVSLKMDKGPDVTTWFVTWVDPMIHFLCTGSKLQKTHIIEYILPKLLKYNPDSLEYMTTKLTEDQTGVSTIGALITCLKRAKMIGILRKSANLDLLTPDHTRDSLWHGVVSLPTLKLALCHQSEQIRLDAFGLLCENPKTTEILLETDTELIKFFLPLNMSSQSPAFRQHLTAMLKKLYIRLRDGAQALRRKIRNGDASSEADLSRYQEFVEWLVATFFRNLYLGASFPCRTSALSSLLTFTTMLSEGKSEFSLSHYMTAEREQTLLECLNDSFEQNKADAFQVLASLPPSSLSLKCSVRLTILFQTALKLASSTRPQDCTTAAYLLRVLLTQPLIHQVATQAKPQETTLVLHQGVNPRPEGTAMGDSSLLPNQPTLTSASQNIKCESSDSEKGSVDSGIDVSERYLVVLEVLVIQLKKQLDMANKSLIHAAATEPLYPTMHCIRCLLSDVDLRNLTRHHMWRPLISDLLNTSFEVAHIVSPVVSNSSPEGNVPRGPGLELNAVIQAGDDQDLLNEAAESINTVNLMPEYLVVCCWRSIKECSLLLGQLTMTAPLTDPERDQDMGLLNVKQLHEIGHYFITQLLESRHRGAFELAYAGFVKMTERLWRCLIPEVQELPKRWLSEIMTDIRSHDPNNRLCSTRRSAGVPFYVQAIASTEPTTTGRACFRELMTELLKLATPANADPHKEDTAQVHSLNVLRALYRDARLGEDVFPFVAEGLRASILGYVSQLWAIRNSATLMFSALMTRIFGVKRSKDEMSKKNCLTGRVFFHRFPSLFQFLLDQLEAATSNIGGSGVYQLHPGLYPVLMVLGRLYPSVVEGSNTTLNTTAFVPYVIRCASSPVYKTRIMAARAIRPLVGKDQIKTTLSSLLDFLPTDPLGATSQNNIHGILLQLTELMESVRELPLAMAEEVITIVVEASSHRSWLLTKDNRCLLTRKAYADLCVTTFSVASDLNISETSEILSLKEFFTNESLEQLSCINHDPSTPGLSEFMQCLAKNLLSATDTQGSEHSTKEPVLSNDATKGKRHNHSKIVYLIIRILKSPMYEVRLEGLEFLNSLFNRDSTTVVTDDDIRLQNCEMRMRRKLEENEVKSLMENTELFREMVTMTLKENHLECLALTLEVMSSSPLAPKLPWLDSNNHEFDHLQVMERLTSCKSSTSDDVRCAAQTLSGRIIPHLYTLASKDWDQCLCMVKLILRRMILQEIKFNTKDCDSCSAASIREWCEDLQIRCATQESVSCRLSAAESLLHNSQQLFIDNKAVLGSEVYNVWSVLMRLLQDEDCDVRDTAALIVHRLAETDGSLNEDVAGIQPVVPTLALDVAVSRMVSLHGSRDWIGVVKRLLSWICMDIEPDWPKQEEKQVRLFDKGEMNTYRDEMTFVNVATRQLMNFIECTVTREHMNDSLLVELDISPCTSPKKRPNGESPGFEMYRSPNANAVINSLRCNNISEKVNGLLLEFRNKIRAVEKIDASSPFLATSIYQENLIGLCRHVMALYALVGVVKTDEDVEALMNRIVREINKKYNSEGTVSNIMVTFDGEKGLFVCGYYINVNSY